MSVLQQIDNHIAEINKSLNWAYYSRMFVLNHLETFDALPDCSLCGNQIDFDNLPHDQVMEVIKAFPGRWKKQPADNGKIHYSITLRNSSKTTELYEIIIRCYSGEPPPNCKIVYEDVEIPAQTVRRPKLICVEQPLVSNGNGVTETIEDKEDALEAEIF